MKVGFVSLGCPKNLVDSEVMLGLVREAGHAIVARPDEADVLVVNTCAFIESARQESIDAILEMAQHKEHGRAQRLVVTGCLAERYRDELQREMPEIDAVLGTGEVPAIVGAITGGASARPLPFYRTPSDAGARSTRAASRVTLARAPSGSPGLATFAPPDYIYDADTPRMRTTPAHYAYVKAAEGCNYTCAFCIIPTLRGRYRSRSVESIVTEARALADRGVRELILISQDTTFYGVDRGDRDALPRLLRALNAIDGLEWIRLLYLYPTTIRDGVLDAMAECDKVCKYIDLPLQHAAASVLRRMQRPGDRAVYTRLLARVRDRLPGVTLRTTFIVGFPGETEQEFAELLAFVDETGFDHIGVFTYSHEEGTPAFGLKDDIPASVKARRRRQIMTRQRRAVAKANRARVGERVRVLVDGPSAEHELVLQGRLEGQAPEIDPVVYFTDCSAESITPGTFVDAEIVGAKGYNLTVTPVAVTPEL